MTATFELRNEMLAAIPSLRAFALSLCHNREYADDLVQETILRAWGSRDRFEPGTNLMAWLFTILRNFYYSESRKARRVVEDSDGSYAARLGTAPEQNTKCDFQDFRAALDKLSPEHREALILIGAQGMSYEDAAHVCGVAIGTLKSRTFRTRESLARLLAVHDAEDLGPDRMTQAALQSAF